MEILCLVHLTVGSMAIIQNVIKPLIPLSISCAWQNTGFEELGPESPILKVFQKLIINMTKQMKTHSKSTHNKQCCNAEYALWKL